MMDKNVRWMRERVRIRLLTPLIFALVGAAASAHMTAARATAPFQRSTALPGQLVEALVDIGRHGIQDAPYVEKRLAISSNSAMVHYWTGSNVARSVSASEFNEIALLHRDVEVIEAEGDVLPMRSGKYWNLFFQYSLIPVSSKASSSVHASEIGIVDVEEYGCVTSYLLQVAFPHQDPGQIGAPEDESSAGYYFFSIKDGDSRKTELLFRGPWKRPGCMAYIGLRSSG